MMLKDQETESTQKQEGRILVKLKIPKNIPSITEENREIKKYTHYCVECYRTFTSGKAFGGHMSSAHVQGNKDNLSLNKLKSKTINNFDFNSDFIICNICNKDFPSKKSLFGHMRSHPERNWRGMRPKEFSESPLDSSSGDDDIEFSYEEETLDFETDDVEVVFPVVDLFEGLKGWSVKGRRGRRSLKPVFDLSVNLEDFEQINAASQILQLVDDSRNPKVEEKMEFNLICENGEIHNKKKRILEDKDLSIDLVKGDKNCKRHNKRVKSLEFGEKDEHFVSVKTPGEFCCGMCEKKFSTHQALGGHMSSHSKVLVNVFNTMDGSTNKFGSNERVANRREIMYDGDVNLYKCKCKVCDRVFDNGKALGGHKKSHGTIIDNNNKAISPSGDEVRYSGKCVFDIDLNKIPDEEDEVGV